MADPRCLIIQVQPPILAKERPNGIEVRKKINEMLDKKGIPQFFPIMAVGYLGAGNIKITTTHTSKASDLMKHGKDIANIITKNEVLSVLPDMEHYHIKINKVLTWCGNNEPMSIDLIHKELCMYLPGYKSMKQWCIPRWLGNEETICTKEFTSIVIDLTNKQDRDNLLEITHLKLFNINCTITPYKERDHKSFNAPNAACTCTTHQAADSQGACSVAQNHMTQATTHLMRSSNVLIAKGNTQVITSCVTPDGSS